MMAIIYFMMQQCKKMLMLPLTTMTLTIMILAVPLPVTEAIACADGVMCAVVRETNDGFVALRSKPEVKSAQIEKLKPYDILVIYKDSCDPTPQWTFVESVPRLDGVWELNKTSATKGYVRSYLIKEAECPTNLDQ